MLYNVLGEKYYITAATFYFIQIFQSRHTESSIVYFSFHKDS